jgi:uncharacterized protein YegL
MTGTHIEARIGDDSYDIDDWVGEDKEPYCYTCQDWIKISGDGNCSSCGESPEGGKWSDGHTARVHASHAPHVSTTGDMWNRGSSYTWGGGGTSWWNTTGSGSLTGMWSTGGYTGVGNASRILKNKRHIDSLLKVVDPTVKHSLHFGNKTSSGNYTNMRTNSIVIDGGLISTDDSMLDILAGLGIHEKLHCIHSHDLVQWQRRTRDEICKSTGEQDLFQAISDIIEDEYIERQLAKTCAGYVHYLEKTKDHFFNKESRSLTDSTKKYADVINTLLMLVRYPSMIDDDRKNKHAPHIRFFARALTNGIYSRDNTYKAIEACYRYLVKVAHKMAVTRTPEEMMKEATDMAESRLESIGDTMTAEDRKRVMASVIEDELTSIERREGHRDSISIDSVVGKLTSSNPDDSSDKGLSSPIGRELQDLEDSDYTEVEMPKSLVFKGQKKITWRRALSDKVNQSTYLSDKLEVKAQINKLKKKIDLYGNTQKLVIRNQKRGRLDKRLLHKIPMGMTDLFRADIVNEEKPLDICLLVDESGSMGSHTMNAARQSAIALKEALADNPKINLWVYGHTADLDYGKETNMTEYWSPSMKDRPFAMGGMRAKAENRDGNAIIASVDRVNSETDNSGQRLLIVMSDGSPSADGYRGWEAIKHTAKCVKHIETKGWSVIQVGFDGCNISTMKEQFTNYLRVENTNELGDKVSKLIRKVVKV